MTPTFPNASESFRKRNPHLMGAPVTVEALPVIEGVRLRQSSKGPNKTELLFEEHLKRLTYKGIHRHPITFEIANGCRYTPDFFVEPDEFYEVKGFMRDDAAVKIKVAARLFPCFKWRLVWRKKGEWITQEILP